MGEIGGKIETPRMPRSVWNRLRVGPVAMVIDVGGGGGEAAATSVYGLVDVDIHKYYLERGYDTDAQGVITMHRWKFRREKNFLIHPARVFSLRKISRRR